MYKEYFWNVVNSLYEDELTAMIDYANQQRNGFDEEDMKGECIEMSEDMHHHMSAHPWVSVSKIYKNILKYIL